MLAYTQACSSLCDQSELLGLLHKSFPLLSWHSSHHKMRRGCSHRTAPFGRSVAKSVKHICLGMLLVLWCGELLHAELPF